MVIILYFNSLEDMTSNIRVIIYMFLSSFMKYISAPDMIWLHGLI